MNGGGGNGGRRPAPGERPRRHHIASVAHHFLGEDDQVPGGRPRPRSVVTAAGEALPVSAFAAAAAARTGAIADGRRWRLLEDARTPWSARTHLADDDRVALVAASEFSRTAAPVHGLCWHLGPATGERLDAWSGACGLPGCGLPTAGTRVHLLWCLAGEHAGALAPLGLLARLAALLEPERISLLAAPRTWPHRGRGGDAGRPTEAELERLEQRAREMCGCPSRVGVIAPSMGTAAAATVVTGFMHGAESA